MKRKIKLSFAELERELDLLVDQHIVLGGNGEPLPNGLCHFNLLSYLMYGTNDHASSIRDDMYEFYGRDSFVDTTLSDGRPVQSYDSNKLDGFMRLSGYNAYQIDNLTSSSIESELDAGSKVGLTYDNHAWVVKDVKANGDIVLEDNTNGGTRTIKSSELSKATGFASNGCLTTDYLHDMFPDRYSTTSIEDQSTTIGNLSTTIDSFSTTFN